MRCTPYASSATAMAGCAQPWWLLMYDDKSNINDNDTHTHYCSSHTVDETDQRNMTCWCWWWWSCRWQPHDLMISTLYMIGDKDGLWCLIHTHRLFSPGWWLGIFAETNSFFAINDPGLQFLFPSIPRFFQANRCDPRSSISTHFSQFHQSSHFIRITYFNIFPSFPAQARFQASPGQSWAWKRWSCAWRFGDWAETSRPSEPVQFSPLGMQ